MTTTFRFTAEAAAVAAATRPGNVFFFFFSIPFGCIRREKRLGLCTPLPPPDVSAAHAFILLPPPPAQRRVFSWYSRGGEGAGFGHSRRASGAEIWRGARAATVKIRIRIRSDVGRSKLSSNQAAEKKKMIIYNFQNAIQSIN